MLVPAVLMASAALMLVVLWQRSPFFSVALFGPLLAIAIYQRSQFRELRTLRLALTDPLTGLGNNRDLSERLRLELLEAEERGAPLSLVLVTLDDFKQVNDAIGHQGGDRVLTRVGSLLGETGEAFRLGGDEFAILLPETDGVDASASADSVLRRIEGLELEHGVLTASAGVATYPSPGTGREDLLRLAAGALDWAKEQRIGQACLWTSEAVEPDHLGRIAGRPQAAIATRN
jgi:diguanylate cyclase (GGDEF)-like protein